MLNLFAILALLLPQQEQRINFKEILKQIILNPLILASLVGLLWSFFQLSMPTIMDRTLHIAAGMTLPLALLSIGNSFSLVNLKGDLAKAGLAAILRLLLLPLLTIGFMMIFRVQGLDFAIGLLMAGAPTAVATYIMATKMGADGELAGTIVVLATALSAISYSVLLFYLQNVSVI